MLRARLKIVGWITWHLIKTHQEDKIITIFRNKGIFLKHAEYIARWKQDKRNQIFAEKLKKQILDEVDRFMSTR